MPHRVVAALPDLLKLAGPAPTSPRLRGSLAVKPMAKLESIFKLWRRGFGKLAEAAPRESAIQKIAQGGEATSSALLELLGGSDERAPPRKRWDETVTA